MSIYLYAFVLNPANAKPGHHDILTGPFRSITITYDTLRGFGYDEEDRPTYDKIFMRHSSGFWYPAVRIQDNDENGRITYEPDLEMGRYSDITTFDEANVPGIITPTIPGRVLTRTDPPNAEYHQYLQACIHEWGWLTKENFDANPRTRD